MLQFNNVEDALQPQNIIALTKLGDPCLFYQNVLGGNRVNRPDRFNKKPLPFP